ncbi:hypothetical protein [Microcystis phage vB_MweS-yong2]|nr:hypothetical protein [Microcystis phage vB_MweS-yong2]
MSGEVERLRAELGAFNRALADGGQVERAVSVAQVRLQLGWIATRGRPWRGGGLSLDFCERAGLAIAEGGGAELSPEGRQARAALDEAAAQNRQEQEARSA